MRSPNPTRRTLDRSLVASIVLLIGLTATAAHAEATEEKEPEGPLGPLFAALVQGDPILDVTFRWEYGKIDRFEHSHGATVRTRLGYETAPLHGVSGLLEMVNTASPKPSSYFDGVETNDSGQTIVADPERTDVNRASLRIHRPDWLGLDLKGGRQRIKLDDDRWIGNVGWRQNEQTFDAVRLQTSLGVEKLVAQYIYAWEVNRIFADQGPPGTRDFGPRSHFLNLAYDFGKPVKAVAFAYLIDPNQANYRAFGSATYGLRLTGSIALGEKVSLPYQASYAFQEDWGNNQTSYDAHYAFAELGLKLAGVGTIAGGYEHLGSDTDARVVTPFSTAHKFNGFADAFLNNGGTRGLRDLWASVAPAIPLEGVKLKLIFHQFWDDQGGDDLGQEFDVVTSWAVNEYLSFLWKFAWYNGSDGGGTKPTILKRTRSILQTTIKF